MVKSLPARPSLEFLKKEAKKLLSAHKRGAKSVCASLKLHHRFKDSPDAEMLAAKLALQEAQHALALHYGFKSWKELTTNVKTLEAEMSTEIGFKNVKQLAALDDRGIQLILREIDTNDLAAAMLDVDAKLKKQVLNNMSKRAVALLRDIMEAGKGTLSPASRKEAAKRMLAIANALLENGSITKDGMGKTPPPSAKTSDDFPSLQDLLKQEPLSTRDTEEMIRAFRMMAETARREGLLSLETIIDNHVDDELTKLGLQLIVDGTDPNYVREITTTRKKALLAALEKRLDIIITAVLGIQSGDNPAILEEKCRAFL